MKEFKLQFKFKFALMAVAVALGLGLGVKGVWAMDGQTLITKYQVSFPIAELGNCTDYSSCKTFCQDPVNATACINFAKKKGFYQEEPSAKLAAAVANAKNTLGCDSFESCQNFCEIPANYDKCAAFARDLGLAGGYVADPGKKDVLEKAKNSLGCTSSNDCQSFCERTENKAKCNSFAQEVGLNGGEHLVGPGGCTSAESCQAFCSNPNNFQVCQGFSSVGGSNNFTGPGGCNSEDSCRKYCQTDPSQCPGFGQNGGQGISPVEVCNRTPNCSWRGNSCACGQYGETENTVAPNSVGGTSKGPGRDPAAACARYGCSWTNNTCQCNSKNVVTTAATFSPGAAGGCTPPTDANFCGTGKHYDYGACSCVSNSQGGCSSQWSCPSGMAWNSNTCDCRTASGDWRPVGVSITTSSTPTPSSAGAAGCQPPSDPNYCGSGKHFSYGSCRCEDNSTGGGCTRIWSCPSGMSWNNSSCDCRTPSGSAQPPSGSTWSNGSPTGGSCQPPSSGCGVNRYFDYAGCVCRENGTPATGSYGGSNNSGGSNYSPTSRDSQEATCRVGGGSCTWNGDMCSCQGYHSPNSGSTTTTSTAPTPAPSTNNTTPNTAPPGMNRDSQEAGCRSCGGSCSWSGDFCNCHCGQSNSGSSSQQSAPAPTPTPSPTPEPTPAPTPTPTTSDQGTVHGAFTARPWWELIWNFFFQR